MVARLRGARFSRKDSDPISDVDQDIADGALADVAGWVGLPEQLYIARLPAERARIFDRATS